eukprot:6208038-Pleurochrysis_carterae.AAC.1
MQLQALLTDPVVAFGDVWSLPQQETGSSSRSEHVADIVKILDLEALSREIWPGFPPPAPGCWYGSKK